MQNSGDPQSEGTRWQTAAAHSELAERDVHIWFASLDRTLAELESLETLLSEDEIARAGRFSFLVDRERYVAGRGILRRLAGSYTGRRPQDIAFIYGEQGKPALGNQNGPGSSEFLAFNVAHTRSHIVFAFTRLPAIGIDLECTDREVDFTAVAQRFFSTREVQELESLPDAQRSEGFFLCWTRKEAYVKARGGGLQIPLDSFDVSLTPGEIPRLRAADGGRWRFASFAHEPNCVGAVVVTQPVTEITYFDWDGLDARRPSVTTGQR